MVYYPKFIIRAPNTNITIPTIIPELHLTINVDLIFFRFVR